MNVIVLPAVQHTGSRFVNNDLLKDYDPATFHEEPTGKTVYHDHLGSNRVPSKFTKLLDKYPAIVPLRHPRRVFKSWIDRKQNIIDCIDEWENLLKYIDPYDPYYLPIDSIDRDIYLGWINKKLEVSPVDWRPRGTDVGTMYMEPEAIKLPERVEEYLKSIEWFTEKFWRESVTETEVVKGVLFKNTSSKRIDAYGYRWQPEGSEGDVTEVKKPSLIEKFRNYQMLEPIEFITEPVKTQTEVTAETLKSQAIAAGMKVDGRWSEKRLKEEIEKYVNGN